MKTRQRDIVEVPFNLPQGIMAHPAIVLSNDDIIFEEGVFIALMLTTDTTDDDNTFELNNEMLSNDLLIPFCQGRLHLISSFRENEIIRNSHHNTIKADPFKKLIYKVNEVTFKIHPTLLAHIY